MSHKEVAYDIWHRVWGLSIGFPEERLSVFHSCDKIVEAPGDGNVMLVSSRSEGVKR